MNSFAPMSRYLSVSSEASVTEAAVSMFFFTSKSYDRATSRPEVSPGRLGRCLRVS